MIPALGSNALIFVEYDDNGNEIDEMFLVRTIVPNVAVTGEPEWDEIPDSCPGYCTGEEVPPILEQFGDFLTDYAKHEISESFKPIWGLNDKDQFVTICPCGIWKSGHQGCIL